MTLLKTSLHSHHFEELYDLQINFTPQGMEKTNVNLADSTIKHVKLLCLSL